MPRYWGQIAVSAAVAGIVWIWIADHTEGALLPLASIAIAYIATRWLLAWLFRIRYWFGRHGAKRYRCPNCHRRRRRLAGDWIPECKRCGWKPGLPGLRWLFHSVPAVQLRRTLSGPSLLIFVACIILASGVAVGTIDGTEFDGLLDGTGTDDSDINQSIVEQEFLRLLNAERTARGLGTVTQWDPLTEMGNDHATNMAKHDYIGHVQPDGSTIQSRFSDRGLLPECTIPTGDGRYYSGAENAAGAYVGRSMERWDTGEIVTIRTAEALAEYIFDVWMASSGHREAMLTPSVGRVGLGVEVTENGKVFAALEMCS